MEYRNQVWTGLFQYGDGQTDPALVDWARATALSEETLGLIPGLSEPAEYSCLDRALADLERLLAALDDYKVEH